MIPRLIRRLFIVTDSRGFTLCCDGTMDALAREASRIPLLAPLTVHDWYLTTEPTMHGGWRKREVFTWP